MLNEKSLLESLKNNNAGLNPCFDGICSMSWCSRSQPYAVGRLNPCFDGICSMSSVARRAKCAKRSLNPCFDGICSMSVHIETVNDQARAKVLILVLMEYAQ